MHEVSRAILISCYQLLKTIILMLQKPKPILETKTRHLLLASPGADIKCFLRLNFCLSCYSLVLLICQFFFTSSFTLWYYFQFFHRLMQLGLEFYLFYHVITTVVCLYVTKSHLFLYTNIKPYIVVETCCLLHRNSRNVNFFRVFLRQNYIKDNIESYGCYNFMEKCKCWFNLTSFKL